MRGRRLAGHHVDARRAGLRPQRPNLPPPRQPRPAQGRGKVTRAVGGGQEVRAPGAAPAHPSTWCGLETWKNQAPGVGGRGGKKNLTQLGEASPAWAILGSRDASAGKAVIHFLAGGPPHPGIYLDQETPPPGIPCGPTCTQRQGPRRGHVTPSFKFQYSLWMCAGPGLGSPSPPNLPPHGGGRWAGVRAPGAGDVPESPLPGPSQPEEAGGAGLVTHFSFLFCQESGGNLLKSLQRKPGRWASLAGSPRAPCRTTPCNSGDPARAARRTPIRRTRGGDPAVVSTRWGAGCGRCGGRGIQVAARLLSFPGASAPPCDSDEK